MKNKLIDYMTCPKENKKINKNHILNITSLLKDFDFNIINNNYSFSFENISIIISEGGIIFISLISSSDILANIYKLSKIAERINSSMDIGYVSTRINIHEQNN
jgi:hypothetical protein